MQELNPRISVLCVQKKSVYKSLVDDCWDEDRDMNNFVGRNAVVAHPPCAQWSRMRGFAKKNENVKRLALACIDIVRKNGGVLEHPASSTLWPTWLPLPGSVDNWGGYSICVNQFWWGHPCEKKTLLYIVGIKERNLPAIPMKMDAIEFMMGPSNKGTIKRSCPKWQRDATPPAFAEWLIEVADRIENKKP